MTDLPEISEDVMNAFFQAAHAAGCGAYISGGQGRLEVDDDHVRAGLSAALVASGWRPEADVRREVAGSLGIPALHALRSIPDGEIRNGCVVMDGAQVRERLRQAYLDIQTPVDEPATALEPSLPLPVADGHEVEQGQERSDG